MKTYNTTWHKTTTSINTKTKSIKLFKERKKERLRERESWLIANGM